MSIFTIIPAKPFEESKTRLASLLSLTQRIDLSRQLLVNTIDIARQASQVVVVTRGNQVREVARAAGAKVVAETKPNLNAAISQGLSWAKTHGARAALILPLDLPFLSVAALQALLEQGSPESPQVVITPCRHNQGTNALLLQPPSILTPHFGQYSFQAHQYQAAAARIPLTIFRHPDIAFDVDTVSDWQAFLNTKPDLVMGWPHPAKTGRSSFL